MDFTEKSARDLNSLCEYAIQKKTAFDIKDYVTEIKPDATQDDFDYYRHLLIMARKLMEKHNFKWFKTVDTGVAVSPNTKPFLDQGGFISILQKENQGQNILNLTESQLAKNIFQLKYWWVFILINIVIGLLVAWLTKGWK